MGSEFLTKEGLFYYMNTKVIRVEVLPEKRITYRVLMYLPLPLTQIRICI